MVGPQVKRQAVDVLREERRFGITRACGLIGISRSLYGYRSRRPPCGDLRQRISELAGDECLNEHWFLTMAQARRVIEHWRIEYNTERPHSSLGDLTPEEFAATANPELLPPFGRETPLRGRP